jgi:Na+/H+ antiporter NhaA
MIIQAHFDRATAGGIALLATEVLAQIRAERALDQCFLALLEQWSLPVRSSGVS